MAEGGVHFIYCKDVGWVDDESGTVKVYATLEWALYTRVGQAVLQLIGEGKQIQTIYPSVPVGEWRPNRFLTFSGGTCVVIQYENASA